jgi:hypothetical protein
MEGCMACDKPCATCKGGPHNYDCLTCATGYVKEIITASPEVFICTNLCQYGFAVNPATSLCEKCDDSCADCTEVGALGSKYCNACAFNRIYHDISHIDHETNNKYVGECLSLCEINLFEYTKYMKDTGLGFKIPVTPVEFNLFTLYQPPSSKTCRYEE